ncbi:histidine phosphatase family protein [Clostridium botulinum]|nr:histidine phosphatase family protein [Clostridium botulinum]NFA01371.1 histidine phosphatase family protein [Clostridium botulinum]NFA33048.1 histidine phosphatase family protein [Clostridium botulinum]NFA87011.1 histidine phosphatase family protein [Clostridium botulinum]NFA91986.1 histidine phosphatase family protein [Clostridium botulinum]
MAQFYLIMPGETDYKTCYKKDLAPLSIKGISQALNMALDPRLKRADIIVSSSHTKATQTASIISQKTNINMIVDMDLEEYNTFDNLLELIDDFNYHNDNYSIEEIIRWEELKSLRTSVKSENRNIGIKAEMDLEESTFEEFLELTEDYNYPSEETEQWEDLSLLRNRVKKVTDKYSHYNKVIIVCNGMFISRLIHAEKVAPGQIIEYYYEIEKN